MVLRTPPIIKSHVLHLWLNGISRDTIVHNVNIGNGSVSRIINDIKSSDIPDLDLLRQLVLKIKNNGFEVVEVASAIRHLNFRRNMGMSEEKMENLLLDLEVYCFKKHQDFHDFANTIDKIKEFEFDFDISINQIPDYLDKMRKELYMLHSDIMTATLFPNDKANGHQI